MAADSAGSANAPAIGIAALFNIDLRVYFVITVLPFIRGRSSRAFLLSL